MSYAPKPFVMPENVDLDIQNIAKMEITASSTKRIVVHIDTMFNILKMY